MGTLKSVRKFGSKLLNYSRKNESEPTPQESSYPRHVTKVNDTIQGRSRERLGEFDFGFKERPSHPTIRACPGKGPSNSKRNDPIAAQSVKVEKQAVRSATHSTDAGTEKPSLSRRLSLSAKMHSLRRKKSLSQRNMSLDSIRLVPPTAKCAERSIPRVRPVSYFATSSQAPLHIRPRRTVSLNKAWPIGLERSVLSFPYDNSSAGTPPTIVGGQASIPDFGSEFSARVAKERRKSARQMSLNASLREPVLDFAGSTPGACNAPRQRCTLRLDEPDEFSLEYGTGYPVASTFNTKRKHMRDSVIDQKRDRPPRNSNPGRVDQSQKGDSMYRTSLKEKNNNTSKMPTRSKSVQSHRDVSIASTLYTAVLSKEARKHKVGYSTSVVPDNLDMFMDLLGELSSDESPSRSHASSRPNDVKSNPSMSATVAPISPRADSPTLIPSFPCIRRNSAPDPGTMSVDGHFSTTMSGTTPPVPSEGTSVPDEKNPKKSRHSLPTNSKLKSMKLRDPEVFNEPLSTLVTNDKPVNLSHTPKTAKLSPFPPLSSTTRSKKKMEKAVLRRLRDSAFSSSEPNLDIELHRTQRRSIRPSHSSGEITKSERPSSMSSSKFTELLDTSLSSHHPMLDSHPSARGSDLKSKSIHKRHLSLKQLLWARAESSADGRSSIQGFSSLPQTRVSSTINLQADPEPIKWPEINDDSGCAPPVGST